MLVFSATLIGVRVRGLTGAFGDWVAVGKTSVRVGTPCFDLSCLGSGD